MSMLNEATDLFRRMTPSEKTKLLSVVAGDPDVQFEGVAITPGVCGGSARLAGHRIPIWLLEAFRRDGVTEDGLLMRYPQLTGKQLAQARAFAEKNRELMDEEIADNEADD